MKRHPGPRPTLGDLQRATPWVWLYCEGCLHHSPLACAVPVIRWGADVSSDVLRQRLAAMKLAGDPNNPLHTIRDDITIDELRAEIMAKMRGLRMFEDMAQLPPPEGVVHKREQREGS